MITDRKPHFEKITKELTELFAKKNQHYGDDYFTTDYPPLERWMSVRRKIARLTAHYEKKLTTNMPEENLKDTWMDLAIYSIMEIMKMELEKEGTDGTSN